MKFAYKGIKFAKDYNRSFAEFVKEFGSNHIFKVIPSNERERELKKVYNNLQRHNGKLPHSTKKRKGNKAEQSKE